MSRQSRIGKFEIIHPIGEGSASAVFLARDTIIGREIAIKTIQGAALAAPDARERFFREAQAAGRLNHPNVVTVHEFGEDNGVAYLVMDFVAGKDLNQLFAARSLKPRECLELMAQVCDALAYAHSKGACHRDLRPSNIMVTQNVGRPCAKVLDIGFTRLFGRDAAAAQPILAPEQVQPGKPDPRADVFALGTILYEALTGVHPFQAEDEAAMRNRLLREDPAPLDLARLDAISPAIQGIVDRALAKDPNRRFPTAAALAEALRAAREPGWSPQADTEQVARAAKARLVPNLPAPTPAGPVRRALTLGIILAVVLGGLGAGVWRLRHHFHIWHRAVPAPVQPVAPPQPVPVTPTPVVAQAEPAPAPRAQAAPPPSPAPAPQPAPKPVVSTPPKVQAPAIEPPKPQAGTLRFHTLAEAEAGVARHAVDALATFESILAADPNNETAMALRIATLYDLGRYGPCAKAMGEAKASGHTIMALSLKSPALHRMLQDEKADPKLPRKPRSTPPENQPR